MKQYSLYALICIFIISCNSKSEKSEETGTSSTTISPVKEPKQLNISILLDLSNRIDTTVNPTIPQHYVRDIEIVKSISNYFVSDMKKRGAFNSKGKIEIIFSPIPNDPNVNLYAQRLKIDCSAMSNPQKKDVYDNLTNTFTDNLTKIYNQTMIDKNWCGSDIWRFFKDDVDMYVDKNDNYRNILVIVTDGYIYHKNTVLNEKDRYSYISPKILEKYKLRNNPNWESDITKTDFGLICKRKDLANLEVLVLEVSAYSEKYKSDEDVIKFVLTKWFSEMGIKTTGLYYSELPIRTQKRITDFFDN